MLQTVRAQKVDEKNWVISLVSMFLSWVMVLKFYKEVIFCNFVLTSAGNLTLLKQFTYMHLTVLSTLFRKMTWWVWTTVHEILAIKISKNMQTQQKSNKFLRLQTLIPSETVRQSMINNTIFWKCVTGPFRCIYVNCFNRLKFLTEVSTKLPKNALFGQFKDHNSGSEHGN